MNRTLIEKKLPAGRGNFWQFPLTYHINYIFAGVGRNKVDAMFEFVFYNSTANPSSVIHPRTPVFTCLEYPVIKSIRVGEDIIKESICPRDAQQGLVFDLSAGSTGPARTQESRNLTAQLHCLWTK
ncbi:hypothetical protein pipiens_011629, partial [Culex pipiens pipiens]